MRKKLRWFAIITFACLFAGALGWIFLQPHEPPPPRAPDPIYNGRKVSDWVGTLWVANEERNPEIKDVVAIGAPAVPFLATRLRDPRPNFARSRAYTKCWNSLPHRLKSRLPSPHLPEHRSITDDRKSAVILVLAKIGPPAKDALPDLIRVVDDPDNAGWVRRSAIGAIIHMGDAQAAIPALTRRLKDDHLRTRRQYSENYGTNYDNIADMWDLIERGYAALAIACITNRCDEAIGPIKALTDVTNLEARADATVALWRLAPDPEIEKTVKDNLLATNANIRWSTIVGLNQIGPPAKPFVPILIDIQDQTDHTNQLWTALQAALTKITPPPPAQ